MTSDYLGPSRGFLHQTGEAAPISTENSYPMMVRRQPRLGKQSQYCLMREIMCSQIS